jgi:hypothetical protein
MRIVSVCVVLCIFFKKNNYFAIPNFTCTHADAAHLADAEDALLHSVERPEQRAEAPCRRRTRRPGPGCR